MRYSSCLCVWRAVADRPRRKILPNIRHPRATLLTQQANITVKHAPHVSCSFVHYACCSIHVSKLCCSLGCSRMILVTKGLIETDSGRSWKDKNRKLNNTAHCGCATWRSKMRLALSLHLYFANMCLACVDFVFIDLINRLLRSWMNYYLHFQTEEW